MHNQKIREAKLPVAIVLAFALLQAVQVGVAAQKGDFVNVIVCVVAMLISLAIVYFIIRETINGTVGELSDRVDRLDSKLKKNMIESVLENLPSHEELLQKAFESISEEIVPGDKKPTTEQLEKIKRVFNKRTGHHAQIINKKDGLHVEFSEKPFAPKRSAPKKPEIKKPGNTAGKVKVTDKKVVAKKPLNRVK